MPPLPKSHILTFTFYLFGAVSQTYLRGCLLGCSPHFAPPQKTTHTLNVVHLFLVDLLIDAAYIKGLFLDD